MSNKTVIVITGPTAVGKTALSIELAEKFGTEIISADSRQFYRELTIGTAKPSEEELSRVPHHFINNISIHQEYNAGKYDQEVQVKLQQLFQKYDVVLLVGGSGMYINAVCNGFDALPEANPFIRDQIIHRFEQEGIVALQQWIAQLDPDYASQVDINNPRRLARAIEVCLTTGKSYSELRIGSEKQRPYNIIKLALVANRDALYQQINKRVDTMMQQGLLSEVESLLPYKKLNALNTVGYKELIAYLEHSYSLERAIELIKQNTRNYAKRQLTWLKRDSELIYVDRTQMNTIYDYLHKLCSQLHND